MPHHKVDDNEFQNLTDQLPAAIFVQIKGRFAYVNRAFLTVMGETDRAALEGKPILTRIPRHRWVETTARMCRTNRDHLQADKADQEFYRADGSLVLVEISSTPYTFTGASGALVFVRDLTEEKNLRALIEELPAGVVVRRGPIVALANREARRILGAAAEASLLGDSMLNLVAEEDRQPALDRMRRLEEGTAEAKATARFRRLDGGWVPVELSAQKFRFEGRDGAVMFLRDLTDDVNFRIMVDHMPLGVLIGTGGQIRYINAAATRLLGADRADQLLGTPVIDRFPPAERPRILELVRRILREGAAVDRSTEQFLRIDGSPVAVEGSAVPFRYGGTDGALVFLRDLTDEREATREILQERERLAVTLRSIGDGVITTDTEGRVVHMSRTAEQQTGWAQEEAAGRLLTEVMPLVHEWTRKPVPNPVDQVLREGTTVELANHTVLVARDGRERLVADTAAPICDAEGRISGVVLVFRDMTERQKLAEALQRAQNLESVGLLAAGIAHDFNNLLSGLFGQIQLAADKVKGGRVVEAQVNFDRALGVFDRARDLTSQLLTFSKGGAPVRTPLDLPVLVKRTVVFALAGSNVGAEFELDEGLPAVSGDPNQLAQAIDNLVINARQAMAGGGTLQVKVDRRTDDAGAWAVVTIQDQGPGIPPEVLSRIFDPFYTTKPGGHGLGLAAVQSILHRHEGRVEVDSAPGRGACFRLLLPCR